MATGKKPLSEAASPAPGRTQQTAQRSKVARRRALVGGLVALLVAGGLALLLTQGGDGIDIPIIGGGDDRETPQLVFESKVVPSTTTTTKQGELVDVVAPVGESVQTTMTTLFQGAFIDPDVWDGDNYEDLFTQVMDEGTATQALADVDTVSLGTGAGDVYAFVQPDKSKLSIKVLTDGKDQPAQAIAVVTFEATAEHDDDTFTAITVTGTYFLRDDGGTWRIFAYDVTKDEEATKPPKSPSPSGATGATGASG